MSLSPKAKQQILRQRMRASFPYFIKITNPDLGEFRYVNSDSDMSFENETYTACYFTMSPPEQTESKIGDGSITISGLHNGGEWIRNVRTSQKRSTLEVVAAIIYSEGLVVDAIEKIYDLVFTITSASWSSDSSAVKLGFIFDEGMEIVMPCDTIDELTCPGVV